MLSIALAAGAGAEPEPSAMLPLSAKADAKPRAVIHVGPHKMGSTSLQEFVFLESSILNEDRYLQVYRSTSSHRQSMAPRLERPLRRATGGRFRLTSTKISPT